MTIRKMRTDKIIKRDVDNRLCIKMPSVASIENCEFDPAVVTYDAKKKKIYIELSYYSEKEFKKKYSNKV